MDLTVPAVDLTFTGTSPKLEVNVIIPTGSLTLAATPPKRSPSKRCENCMVYSANPHDGYDGHCCWIPPVRLALMWDPNVTHPMGDVFVDDTCSVWEPI